ncbi:hypothetical protein B0H19DRAFT_75029 [Mycena capillaripes]|nr:hypothetical protein B0H19DRAFT_75029 [Mycena capillaripes]
MQPLASCGYFYCLAPEFCRFRIICPLATLFGVEPPLDVYPAVLITDLWFSRSSGCPLSIKMRIVRISRLPDGLMAIIGARSAQWELLIPHRDVLQFNKISDPLCLLQSLAMNVANSCGPAPRMSWNPALCTQAPNLGSLRLGSSFIGPYTKGTHALSTSLTTLECCTISSGVTADVAWIFRLFPNPSHSSSTMGSLAVVLLFSCQFYVVRNSEHLFPCARSTF